MCPGPCVWLVPVALLAAAPPSAPEPDVKAFAQALRYAQHGKAALQRGHLDRAAKDFARALSGVPDLPDAHVGLGHLATHEKRYEDALREYRAAEAGYRALAPLILKFADDRYARAQDELRRLREQKARLDDDAAQDMARAATNGEVLGRIRPEKLESMRAELDARIRDLQAMSAPAQEAPDEPPAMLVFFEGNALFSLGRVDEAIAAWETARSRDPHLAPVENNLAVAYWKQGRLDEAASALERADALGFPVDPRFRADLAAARARERPPGD